MEIKTVCTEADIEAFIRFPFTLYKENPYWVGELQADTKHLLDEKNPFWADASRALFMAYDEGKPLFFLPLRIGSKRKGSRRCAVRPIRPVTMFMAC